MTRNTVKMVLAFGITLAMASPTQAGQKDVLRSMEKVQAYSETSSNYEKYFDSITDLQAELNMYKRQKKVNRCLVSHTEDFIRNHTLTKMSISMGALIPAPLRLTLNYAYECLDKK